MFKDIKKKGEYLASNFMDKTHFLLFTTEDFSSTVTIKKEKIETEVLDQLEFVRAMCNDYKVLLESTHIVFWSTVQYNKFLNTSLDSFLRFSKRKQFSPFETNIFGLQRNISFTEKEVMYENYWDELYRLVFMIYSRLVHEPLQENTDCYKMFQSKRADIYELLYGKWYFDMAKMLDLCGIYGEQNEQELKRMLVSLFKAIPDYFADLKEMITDINEKILPSINKSLATYRRRAEVDAETLQHDTQKKTKLLIQLYDITMNLVYICKHFPLSSREFLLQNTKFLLTLENVFVVLNSSYKMWKVDESGEGLFKFCLKAINKNILDVFKILIDNFILNHIHKPEEIKKDYLNNFYAFLKDTGTTTRKAKIEAPNYYFTRKLMDVVNLGLIIQNTPTGVIEDSQLDLFTELTYKLMDEKEQTDKRKQQSNQATQSSETTTTQNHKRIEEKKIEQPTKVEDTKIEQDQTKNLQGNIENKAPPPKVVMITEITRGKK